MGHIGHGVEGIRGQLRGPAAGADGWQGGACCHCSQAMESLRFIMRRTAPAMAKRWGQGTAWAVGNTLVGRHVRGTACVVGGHVGGHVGYPAPRPWHTSNPRHPWSRVTLPLPDSQQKTVLVQSLQRHVVCSLCAMCLAPKVPAGVMWPVQCL